MIEFYLAPSTVFPHYEAWPTITLYTGHMHEHTHMHMYGKKSYMYNTHQHIQMYYISLFN